MNRFIIDCYTTPQVGGITGAVPGKTAMIGKLNKHPMTHQVNDGGCYREAPNLSQVLLTTYWNENELDKWLYDTPGVFSLGILQTA